MFEPASLLIFILASMALLIVPGPAVLYIVARSLEQGRMAGIISTLGVASASLIHVFFSALGLSTLLMNSATAFNIVKYLGAAYLICLGLRTLLTRQKTDNNNITVMTAAASKLFWQGFVVNLLNPKTALFFLAFFPQFVNPAQGQMTLQIMLLGSIFVALALLSDGIYAIIAGQVRQLLSARAIVNQLQNTVCALVYIGLGAATALFSFNEQK